MMSRKSTYGLLAALPLAGLLGLVGCSGVTATQPERYARIQRKRRRSQGSGDTLSEQGAAIRRGGGSL